MSSVVGPTEVEVTGLPSCPFKIGHAFKFTCHEGRESSLVARLTAARWLVDVGFVPGVVPRSGVGWPVPVYLPRMTQAGQSWSRLPARLRGYLPAALLTSWSRGEKSAYVAFADRFDAIRAMDARAAAAGRGVCLALVSAPWEHDGDNWRACRSGRSMRAAEPLGHVSIADDEAVLSTMGEELVRALASRRLAYRKLVRPDVVASWPCVMCGYLAKPSGWCSDCVAWLNLNTGGLRLCGLRPGRWRIRTRHRVNDRVEVLEHPGQVLKLKPDRDSLVTPIDYSARLADAMLRA